MKYQLYIVKKFYIPLEIEADSPAQAEEKGYQFLEANNLDGVFNSDDTYIYNYGELENA